MGGNSIDWANEWFNSLVWIIGVFVAAVVGTALVGWILLRSTVWGRQFKRLAMPYFRPGRGRESWQPLIMALLVLLATVAAVRLNVLLSYSTQRPVHRAAGPRLRRRSPGSWASSACWPPCTSSARCSTTCVTQTAGHPVAGVAERPHASTTGSSDKAYHRGQYTKSAVDNPDQRIQEDVASFTSTSADLALGAIGSMISLVSFSFILWQLSGPLEIVGVEIPRAMIFIAYIYVIIASVIAFRIGRPLIRLNFLNERVQRLLPVRAGPGAGQHGAHRVLPRRGRRARRRWPAGSRRSSATTGRSCSGA